MTATGPTCPVCHQMVALTPMRGQVKVHRIFSGERCLGTSQPPVLSNNAWWQSVRFRRLGKRAYGFICTGVAGVLGILGYLHIQPDSVKEKSSSTSGMSVGISSRAYRLILPIQNPQSQDETVSSLTVWASFWAPPCAEGPFGLVYQVESSVNVDSKSGARGSVSASSGPAAGFASAFTGLLSYGCGWNQLQFSFVPPGATLVHLSTTPLAIDLPRELKVTQSNDSNFASSEVVLPTVDDPDNPVVTFIAFRILAETPRSGTINSCYLLAGVRSTDKTGLKDCRAQIDGRNVFSPEKLDVNKPRVPNS